MRVAGGWLVEAGTGELVQDDEQESHIGRVVVVDKPVTGAGIDLDVVVDAGRS